MQANLLRRIYKLSGLIIVFHSIWFLVVIVIFILMLTLEKGKELILATLPVMAIISVLFTIYINRKLKLIRKYHDNESKEKMDL